MLIFIFRTFFIIFLVWPLFERPLKAIEIDSFADGACWLAEESTPTGQSFKFISFNDNIAVTFSKDEILYSLNELSDPKFSRKNINISELNFHCGSYGHSVIVMDKTADQCIWMYFKEGAWQMRSFGILGPFEEQLKSCHGLRPGTLIISLFKVEDKEIVKSELQKLYSDEIESLTDITSKVIKLSLKEKYIGSEKKVRETLLKNQFFGPKVIVEFNLLTHPVGEFKE